MATGITKREQLSADAISALNLTQEERPLPDGSTPVELSYQNKALLEEIRCMEPYKFLRISTPPPFGPQTLTDNSFILADNFFVLNDLIARGRKATLFYLDPPYGTGYDFHSKYFSLKI